MLQPKPVRKHKEESLKPKQQRTLNYLLPTQAVAKLSTSYSEHAQNSLQLTLKPLNYSLVARSKLDYRIAKESVE